MLAMIYGYACVSTDGQSVGAQVEQRVAASCAKVFREVASGSKTNRAQLRRALAKLESGDVLMLTVLGGLAEFERELIRARTSEGRARAKARGQSLGRPHKLTLHQRREALQRRDAGEPVREIVRSYAVSASTISRLAG